MLRLFVRVVSTASFSKAAKAEGVGQSTVSKQVAALEARLGSPLLRRSSRGISVTEVGQDFYETAVRLLAELEEAETRAKRGLIVPTGRIKAAMPAGLGPKYVLPQLPAFFARYPDVVLELDISDRYVDLVADGIDIAIRIGHLPDSTLLARRIGSVRTATVATPGYLKEHGTPSKPSDLKRHACVSYIFQGNPRLWDFAAPKGVSKVMPSGRLRANDADHVRAGILAGLGIGHCPTWLVADAIESGAVVCLLTDQAPPLYPIHAVWPGGRQMSGKVKVFVDFLADAFAQNPHLKIR